MDPATHASPEPQCTLYTTKWSVGRERASRIVSARYRATFTTLLDCVEQGWTILRPLQVTAETWRWNQSFTGTQRAVADFVDIEVCDLFRTIAWDCAAMPPGPGAYQDVQVFEDTEAEIEVVRRNLTVAALGVEHPEFPEPFRAVVRDAAASFEPWMERLQPALSRALDVVGDVCRGKPMPRLRDARKGQ